MSVCLCVCVYVYGMFLRKRRKTAFSPVARRRDELLGKIELNSVRLIFLSWGKKDSACPSFVTHTVYTQSILEIQYISSAMYKLYVKFGVRSLWDKNLEEGNYHLSLVFDFLTEERNREIAFCYYAYIISILLHTQINYSHKISHTQTRYSPINFVLT